LPRAEAQSGSSFPAPLKRLDVVFAVFDTGPLLCEMALVLKRDRQVASGARMCGWFPDAAMVRREPVRRRRGGTS
jgi:hypothetical protein